jgi:replication factor C subunit 1
LQELGYDTVEFNASDTRSKKLLHEHVANMLNNTSVSSLFHHTDKVSSWGCGCI